MVQESQQPQPRFTPSDHLINLPKRTKDQYGNWVSVDQAYLETKWRIYWCRLEHPDAEFDSQYSAFADGIIVQAKVTLPGSGSAVGIGFCTPQMFERYPEKADTTAIGRALACLGYGTQFCDDFEESDGNLADAPVAPSNAPQSQNAAPHAPQAQPTAARPPQAAQGQRAQPRPQGAPPLRQGGTGQIRQPGMPATTAQMNAIFVIGEKEKGLNPEEIDQTCMQMFNVMSDGLTKGQASQLIDLWKQGAAR